MSGATNVQGTGPSAATAAQTPSDQSSGAVAFAWLLAWTVMGTLLWLLNRTRIGHLIVYYLLVLMIVLLLVTNAGQFAQALKPFTDAVAGQGVDQGPIPVENNPGVS